MADAVICSECGAAVPAGRARCGRCGGRGNVAVSPARDRGEWPTRIAVIGAVTLVVAVAIGMLVRSPEPVADGQPQAVDAPAPTQAPPTPGDTPTPAPMFAAASSSREGINSYNGGDLSAALRQFTAAVEHDPNNADALNNLGQVLVRSSRTREAIPYFDRAIAASDGVWAYHFNRARAYGELKEWRQAIAGYTDAARLFPDDYITQFNLARARQADGDLTGAIQAYARATALAPGQADFQLSYGQALDQAGRGPEAAVAYRRFLELDPGASQAEKVKARLSQLGDAPKGPSS